MLLVTNMSLSVVMALVMSFAMTVTAVVIFFFHDQKHQDLDRWIDYGFSRETLKHALIYYRLLAISMLVFYALFVGNLLWLQAEGYAIYPDGRHGVIATSFFALDLVTRGALFDVMEHWDLRLTPLLMNRKSFWVVMYCFVFRMFYALALIRIAISFAWIWTKIRMARQQHISSEDGGR